MEMGTKEIEPSNICSMKAETPKTQSEKVHCSNLGSPPTYAKNDALFTTANRQFWTSRDSVMERDENK